MRATFEEARLRLAQLHVESAISRRTVVEQATRITGRALQIERVGVWLFDPERETLRCEVLYSCSANQHIDGEILQRQDRPTYFATLRERRVIVADDALHNESTSGLRDYLAARSISSMMDAAIYVRGEVAGVVCHEHVGPIRQWTQAEIDFAGSVADILGVLFEQDGLHRCEEDLRLLTARRQDSARLEILTRATGAFVHDFNNVLTAGLLIGARLAGDAQPETAALGHDLVSSLDVGRRLLHQLRSFGAHDDSPEQRVGQVFDQLRPILALLIRDVELTIDVSAPQLSVPTPRLHLEQIILNLCLNAQDARRDPHGWIKVRAFLTEGRLGIDVSDNGTGIPDEILPFVFDDYFTTKATGTGLGLAIVRDLVAEHGGTISVRSEVGSGTTFAVRLPASTA